MALAKTRALFLGAAPLLGFSAAGCECEEETDRGADAGDGGHGQADRDGDGLPNYIDTDADADTILDIDEGTGDSDGDTHDDVFVGVPAGTPVCWTVHVKDNVSVPATTESQMFEATVEVYADGITLLDVRRVFFVVPPIPPEQ